MFVSSGLRSLRGASVFSSSMFTRFAIALLLLSLLAHWLLIQFPESPFHSTSTWKPLFPQLARRKSFFSTSSSSYYSHNNYSNSTNANGSEVSSSPLNYKTFVAYQPKDRDDQIYKNLKDSLMSPTGEDNFFIASIDSNDVYAGVADGVGGWAERNYDSSAISRELCRAMDQLATATLVSSKNQKYSDVISPKDLMDVAFEKIQNDKIVEVGGTTSIVAHFQKNGTLNVANLGDSWCGVFRNYKLVFQTKFQTVGFNAPYQLSIIPKHLLEEARLKGTSYIRNTPADVDEYSFQLSQNDIVILATDGVTDNISTDDISLFLKDNSEKLSTSKELNAMTKDFVSKVVNLSKDPDYPSVFSQEYSRLTGRLYKGGKEDDITVVLVKVE
ncbi:type 2C protein phosphatase PTC7 NDAI_0C01920 [Naumovozyma dairenensis CBS 421]|uniref:Protein phosphatase n=1 Tax=Naumovozyma dairenensis (strain ATCC 10597 / BCRC 20456 / CBS 421 / NBRC 0211 / NRRL Y-12639) TaxID=1071378 RepID=G0W7U1_NAUDC|nr:hypothetical protein NDAI_0C01920 [Naumovozyma dairenensis CBS 421]CCD23852.1 hypothetical protein NDAI_0C01920 [Naumovozyma dairenensis CBS 421]